MTVIHHCQRIYVPEVFVAERSPQTVTESTMRASAPVAFWCVCVYMCVCVCLCLCVSLDEGGSGCGCRCRCGGG